MRSELVDLCPVALEGHLLTLLALAWEGHICFSPQQFPPQTPCNQADFKEADFY